MDIATYRNMYKIIAGGDKEWRDAIIKLIDYSIEATFNKWMIGSSSNGNDEATKAYLKYVRLFKWNVSNAREHYEGIKEQMDTLDWMVPEWLQEGKSGKQAHAELMYDVDSPMKPQKGGKNARK